MGILAVLLASCSLPVDPEWEQVSNKGIGEPGAEVPLPGGTVTDLDLTDKIPAPQTSVLPTEYLFGPSYQYIGPVKWSASGGGNGGSSLVNTTDDTVIK
jgi:hypothetical protein